MDSAAHEPEICTAVYRLVPPIATQEVIAERILVDRPRTLAAAFVCNVNKPGRYGDGRGGYGLSLLVRATRNGQPSKTWSQRL